MFKLIFCTYDELYCHAEITEDYAKNGTLVQLRFMQVWIFSQYIGYFLYVYLCIQYNTDLEDNPLKMICTVLETHQLTLLVINVWCVISAPMQSLNTVNCTIYFIRVT